MRYGLPFTALLTVALSPLSTAGEIVLTNGDTLQGQLLEQNAQGVIWVSESFGNLSIPVENIATINGTPVTQLIAAATAEPELVVSDEPVNKPIEDYKGTLSFTGAFADGSERREDWDLETGVEWRHDNQRHRTSANYESHSLNGSPADEEYELAYGLDWFFQEQWYWNNSVTWEANENRAIDQRYTLGSAIGHQLWDEESRALSVETGLLWINEEFEDGTDNERLNWRWGADYRTSIFGNLEFFHTHELLVSLEDTDDSEVKADFGLKAPVVDNLFTELKLEWVYDNQPAEGAERNDSQVTIGVNYSW